MSPLIQAPVIERTTTSRDGTTIAYHVVGSGPRHWLMPPAMGAPLLAMRTLFERLQDDFTFVSWDMRGFHGSSAPQDPDAYDVDRHLDDLEAVERDSGLVDEKVVLGGWSMGVQLSLERYHRRPDSVSAMVLVNGTHGRALDIMHPKLAPAIARGLMFARRAAPLANRLSRRASAPKTARLMERFGLLARGGEHFEAVFAQFQKVHWGRYATVMAKLHEHSATRYLPHVSVPTLITAGGRDTMTPVHVAEVMHNAIGGSELFVIPDGTHYMPLEYGEEIASRAGDFLRQSQ